MALPTTNSQSHSSTTIKYRLTCAAKTMQTLFLCCSTKVASCTRWLLSLTSRLYRFLLTRLDPLWALLMYFVLSSLFGFLAMRIIGQKPGKPKPSELDLLFTAVSAATVSSMSTVGMEVLSNGQLVIMALLMLIGGEVFNSMFQLHLLRAKLVEKENIDQLPQVVVVKDIKHSADVEEDNNNDKNSLKMNISVFELDWKGDKELENNLKRSSFRMLALVILAYLAVAHVFGFITTIIYFTLVSLTAKDVLTKKGLDPILFSSFLTVSSFASGGFVPTKEGMIPFKNNSGLLIMLLPLLLAGNTLFPSCLRLVLWVLKKWTKKPEFEYLTRETELERQFHHLVPKRHSIYLAYTSLAFILAQLLLLCCLEWNNNAFVGMNAGRKIVAALFQSVNSRHAGESTLDLSTLSPAITVLYIAMMYLPPYTVFLPGGDETRKQRTDGNEEQTRKLGLRKSLVMSHLSYIVMFIILVCITERQKIAEDPLNFNILSITTEVVSSYGNVGFTMGYSCGRQLKPDPMCQDHWYGFVGRWSTQGKLIIIFIMFFGRLKKFNMKGGRAWKVC